MNFLFAVFAVVLSCATAVASPERAVPKVDYLLVLDDSAGFEPFRTVALRRFDGFLDRLRSAGMDFRVAVTTTSVQEVAGRLFGPVPVITNRTPQALQNFNLNLAMALENPGADLERGFDSTLAALTAHPDFHRPDARLIVTVVTTEDDRSSVNGAAFMKSMNTLIPSPLGWQMDFVGSIDMYECPMPGSGYVEPGFNYMNVAYQTRGIALGLCSNRRRF